MLWAPPNPQQKYRAAQDEDNTAYETLGYIYAQGWGVEVNFMVAYEYYGHALLLGNIEAKQNMDRLWRTFKEDERDELRAIFAAGS